METLYDLAMRAYVRVSRLVARYKYSWTDLPESLQEEMDGVIETISEAAQLDSMAAQVALADIHTFAHGGKSGNTDTQLPRWRPYSSAPM